MALTAAEQIFLQSLADAGVSEEEGIEALKDQRLKASAPQTGLGVQAEDIVVEETEPTLTKKEIRQLPKEERKEARQERKAAIEATTDVPQVFQKGGVFGGGALASGLRKEAVEGPATGVEGVVLGAEKRIGQAGTTVSTAAQQLASKLAPEDRREEVQTGIKQRTGEAREALRPTTGAQKLGATGVDIAATLAGGAVGSAAGRGALAAAPKLAATKAGTIAIPFLGESIGSSIAFEAVRGEEVTPEGLGTGALIDIAAQGLFKIPPGARKGLQKLTANKVKQVDNVVGQIIQGEAKDVPGALRALTSIDTKGVKTTNELRQRLIPNKAALGRKQHELLSEVTTLFKPDELTKVTKVGDIAVEQNFVDEALEGLSEIYESAAEPANVERVRQLAAKYVDEGLSLSEVNDIAIEFGGKVKSKAFTKAGEPKTSISAAKFENIRKGVKNAFRDKLPNDVSKEIDKQLSDLIGVDTLLQKVEKRITKASQRLERPTFVKKASGFLAKAPLGLVNILTGGGSSAFLKAVAASVKGETATKGLSTLDIEKQLSRNLKFIDKMADGTDKEALKALEEFMKQTKATTVIKGIRKASAKGAKQVASPTASAIAVEEEVFA